MIFQVRRTEVCSPCCDQSCIQSGKFTSHTSIITKRLRDYRDFLRRVLHRPTTNTYQFEKHLQSEIAWKWTKSYRNNDYCCDDSCPAWWLQLSFNSTWMEAGYPVRTTHVMKPHSTTSSVYLMNFLYYPLMIQSGRLSLLRAVPSPSISRTVTQSLLLAFPKA